MRIDRLITAFKKSVGYPDKLNLNHLSFVVPKSYYIIPGKVQKLRYNQKRNVNKQAVHEVLPLHYSARPTECRSRLYFDFWPALRIYLSFLFLNPLFGTPILLPGGLFSFLLILTW